MYCFKTSECQQVNIQQIDACTKYSEEGIERQECLLSTHKAMGHPEDKNQNETPACGKRP